MFVVWKRPDGYHDATPGDFRIAEAGANARIWLHKSDREWYPFRISGGWQESDATRRLNGLVNLLGDSAEAWTGFLTNAFHHSMTDDPKTFVTEQVAWLNDLRAHLKGDTWETEIMGQVITEVASKVAETGGKIRATK